MQTKADNNDAQDDFLSNAVAVDEVFGTSFAADGEDGEDADKKSSVGSEGGEGDEGDDDSSSSSELPKDDNADDNDDSQDAGDTGKAQQQPVDKTKPAEKPAAKEPEVKPDNNEVLEKQSLKAQLAAMQAKLDEMSKSSEPTKGDDTGKPDEGSDKKELPSIKVQLPEQVKSALFGEDPEQASQALDSVLSSLATGLTRGFEAKLDALRAEMQTAKTEPKAKKTSEATPDDDAIAQAQTQREDYFKSFPDHNKPVLLPIIQQESMQLAAEHPGVPWSNEFRDALGARVNKALEDAGFVSSPTGNPVPKKPAAMLPKGTSGEQRERGGQMSQEQMAAEVFS